ncbi:MAG: N-acetylmuramic acid 6-phosphate etherase [Candidatus Methanomethylicia archaeon]|nr:N-acetylmuramic acid 6-phosphate etherase [Candidatus Methanomethylicia archaeon]
MHEKSRIVFEKLCEIPTETKIMEKWNIDKLPTIEILRIINEEDKKAVEAVGRELESISKAVELICQSLSNGGRMIYIGAGTSGRLAIIDVAELMPTFNVGPEIAEAIIAGGPGAVFRAIEGAEDDEEMAVRELKARRIRELDVIIGISASGRTPFVISALKYAKSVGAKTIAITSNRRGEIINYADIVIAPETGPEVITGSTRMKAATAQKTILTMMSTTIMIKLGRIKNGLMINLTPVSDKLKERAKRIIMEEAGVSHEEAERKLFESGGSVTLAIIMAKTGLNICEARKLLEEAKGIPLKAIELAEVKKFGKS